MNLNLFKNNLVFISSLVSLTIGSSASSFYHRRQIAEQRKAFVECQQAWEKYYSLTKESANPTYNLAKQIDRKIKLDSLTKKLNHYGWEINQEEIENLINHSFYYSIGVITYKLQGYLPLMGYFIKSKKSKQLSKEKSRERIYHYEVLPKCQKLKDWQKYMNKIQRNDNDQKRIN